MTPKIGDSNHKTKQKKKEKCDMICPKKNNTVRSKWSDIWFRLEKLNQNKKYSDLKYYVKYWKKQVKMTIIWQYLTFNDMVWLLNRYSLHFETNLPTWFDPIEYSKSKTKVNKFA